MARMGLANAAKYSAPDAAIEVTIRQHSDRAQVIVRDHGTGVTPGDTEMIFGKFYQDDPGSPGAGLVWDHGEVPQRMRGRAMPLFMDRHELEGATAQDLTVAHAQDVEVQDRHGVRYLTYWFDYPAQRAFCLVDAPDAAAAEAVHAESHGILANRIIPVAAVLLTQV